MKEPSILSRLTAARAAAARTIDSADLRRRIATMPAPPDFAAAFRTPRLHIIAELKKASPSRGLIRAVFTPRELACELARAGAAAISVLTEPEYFLGNIDYLRQVSETVSIPLLCKDFITTEAQILQARANGASAILLIAAALSPARFRELRQYAESLSLHALCETHNAGEIAMVLDGGARIIGVNARNLHDFSMSPETSLELLKTIPASVVRIAESGIITRPQLELFRQAGADGFLIGEALMRETSPGAKLRELLAETSAPLAEP